MAKKKYYAVRSGHVPGIYESWPEAERQVKGYGGAVFKGFATEDEASDWLQDVRFTKHPSKKKTADKAPFTVAPPAAGEMHIFTDGGAINNPGPGGYGIVIVTTGESREFSGGFRHTTNNRMELKAAIIALQKIDGANEEITLFSDSSYVVHGISKGWVKSWQRNGWRKSDGKAVLNRDLWEELISLVDKHRIHFVWVKGHAGHPMNERCDKLAVQSARGANLAIDAMYERDEGQPGR